jgi:hypothetical protein
LLQAATMQMTMPLIFASQSVGYLAGVFGIPAKQMGEIIHKIKRRAKMLGGSDNIEVDPGTGAVKIEGTDEEIDNVNDYLEE